MPTGAMRAFMHVHPLVETKAQHHQLLLNDIALVGRPLFPKRKEAFAV